MGLGAYNNKPLALLYIRSQIKTQYTLQRRRSWRGHARVVSRDHTRKYTIKSVRFCKFQRFQISKLKDST